jgi:hypothetical protein
MAKRGSPVRSQMPQDRPPAIRGAKGSINQYPHGPFSGWPHDSGGPGGLPVKIMESHGERLPTDHAPGQAAPPKPTGRPAIGKRRWS